MIYPQRNLKRKYIIFFTSIFVLTLANIVASTVILSMLVTKKMFSPKTPIVYLDPVQNVQLLNDPTLPPTVTPTTSSSQTPTLSLTPTPVVKKSMKGFGISGGGVDHFDQKDLDQYFESLKSLGVHWVRYDIDWSVVQKDSPTSYNWAGIDRVTATAKRYGLSSLGVITYTPRWASAESCGAKLKCPPVDPAAFGRFAGQVVSRYKNSIKYWQVWNEPNLAGFLGSSSDIKKYADILREASTEIKKIDPQAVVLTGGIAASDDGQDGSLSPPTFIQTLYKLNAKPYFDAVALHPYSYPAAPSYPEKWNSWQQISSVRQAMVANGDSAKKIWITEYGAPTGGPGNMYVINQFSFNDGSDYMSEAAQEEMARQAATLYKNQLGDWMGPFFWYSLTDEGTSKDTPENFFGLLRFDGSKKPAYETFKSIINQ